jgi:DNA-binding MarR family transcriptional regulator
VGQRLELDKATISQLMKRLDERALIDRAPAYQTRENRIYLQSEGERLARQGRIIVEVVSHAVEVER